jgi:cation:H+ antiporter
MFTQIFIFVVALLVVMRGATIATTYAGLLATSFKLSQYTVGFIVVAVISILPETFIALNAAFEGIPSFGFGMILGSNVADLTLIIALIVFIARRPLKVESKILKNHALYPFLLLLPIILGFDGYLSRPEGGALIVAGIVFYYLTLRHASGSTPVPIEKKADRFKDTLFILLGVALLLIGSHFTVSSASNIALMSGVSPVLIGMLIVGLGTTMPELFFSLEAVRHNHDALAIGDILGTVLADATIVIGILALLAPFAFPTTIIYVAGVFMVSAAFILFSFMRSGKVITGKEAFVLLVFWLTFILIECIITL